MNASKISVVSAILLLISLTAIAEDFKLTSADVANKATIGSKHIFNGFGW